ncbi:hypothetical protein JCGZ_04095 [Jatropha curcas]|uniref:non-specific serine/threonine protein kinase n=1 Tax=Jatropha curcas TaxID=180498 RepID=A0A067KRM1_JATCU|nr:hypothetical protein JCGZ_04095 [Jatropha curcas]
MELNLQSLALDGSISPYIRNLTFLKILNLNNNSFIYQIPEQIGHLRRLEELRLTNNSMSGKMPRTIPYSLGNLSQLLLLSLAFNGLAGTILSLLENKLTGQVPSLAKLNKLRAFIVTLNYLGNGDSDDLSFLFSLLNATVLEKLLINGNNFGGTIPETIGNLSTSLVRFFLDNNQIIGNIPSDVGNLVRLQDFEVWNNKLSGFIPDGIGKLRNLVVFALNNNMFSGEIPSSIGNLTNLIQFVAFENNLSGSIPSNIGKCENLLGLDLSQNKLSGSIPSQVLNLSSLSIYLDLSQNNFTGNLPIEVGNLKNLGEFDVSENKLSGEIPSSLGSCISMETLDLSGNNFQGPIPAALSSLKALQALDLSKNNLSGEIPEFLSHWRILQYLNLSYNNFEGMVPTKGIFENASATSVEGNNMLCGGIPKFHLPKCHPLRHKKNRLTPTLKLVVAIISVIVGALLVLSVLFLLRLKQKIRKEPAASNFSDKKILELSYRTLHKSTNGFSSDNLIGMGNFGSVYKGTLDGGATLIAVKVFNLMRRGAFKSFLAECEALRGIRHRNLVKVLTACSSIAHHGNDFKALVYEFMVNGSLDDWLHPTVSTNEESEATQKLNILQRLNIAIDVASALDYLHNNCEIPIVHRDLKPSNVLLDNELTGHVSDFGLARFLPLAAIYHNSESSSTGARGTVGYAPPEYGMGNEVSTYGDVYSYGILLLEMFTGKRPTDEIFNGSFNLHNFVKVALPNNVVEVVDPVLVSEKGEAISNVSVECLISIFQIGVDCSIASPSERMSIPDVIRQLASIKDKLVGNEVHNARTSYNFY